MRLARYFGNSPRFWLNLQTTYELEVAEAGALANGSPPKSRARGRMIGASSDRRAKPSSGRASPATFSLGRRDARYRHDQPGRAGRKR